MSSVYSWQNANLGVTRTLFAVINANMNVTTDQAFVRLGDFSKFWIDKIVATDASGAMTTAIGGIYTGASKSGTIIVSAAQAYSGVTAVDSLLPLTLTAAGTRLLTSVGLILSLSTPLGSAGTCNFYAVGTAIS